MSLLSEVFEKYARSVTATVSLHDVNPGLVARIHELARIHKGRCNLQIRIADDEERMCVELPSRKFKVEGKEFIIALERQEMIKCKID